MKLTVVGMARRARLSGSRLGDVFGVVSVAGPGARVVVVAVPGGGLGIFLGVSRHEWDGVSSIGWNCSIWAKRVEWVRKG